MAEEWDRMDGMEEGEQREVGEDEESQVRGRRRKRGEGREIIG